MTVLMGGTLIVLVRTRVRSDLDASGWRIGVLYGINTLGAAVGAFVTDFAFVPAFGLLATQLVAVAVNFVAAAGAFLLGRVSAPLVIDSASPITDRTVDSIANVGWASMGLALSGCAVLGVEMLWLRHLSVLLGGFRAVLSLLLTVMLLALGIGALIGGWIERRFGHPARTLIVVQGVFAAVTLIGLASNSAADLAAYGASLAASLGTVSPSSRIARELWFNLRPMLIEVALPSLVAGLAFPLANAIVQRAHDAVGRRAGMLYAANTCGVVTGSLLTGYVLLPRLGMQSSAAVLAAVAGLAIGFWPGARASTSCSPSSNARAVAEDC
jgi:spermidine synthase